MGQLNRVWRPRVFALALTMSITMSFAAAQAAPPEGSGMGAACPEPMNKFFGHFVMVSATAHVGLQKLDEKKEKTCWVAGASASGQNNVVSQDGEQSASADYSYTIGPTGITGSATVDGKMNSNHVSGGTSGAMLWLMWHDTLTFHSSLIPLIDPNDFRSGNPPTAKQLVEQMIQFKVKLLQNPPQCSGLNEPEFKYFTGVAAAVVDIQGGKGMIAPGRGPARSHVRELAPARGYLRHPLKFRHCPGTQRPKRGRTHHRPGEPAGQYWTKKPCRPPQGGFVGSAAVHRSSRQTERSHRHRRQRRRLLVPVALVACATVYVGIAALG